MHFEFLPTVLNQDPQTRSEPNCLIYFWLHLYCFTVKGCCVYIFIPNHSVHTIQFNIVVVKWHLNLVLITNMPLTDIFWETETLIIILIIGWFKGYCLTDFLSPTHLKVGQLWWVSRVKNESTNSKFPLTPLQLSTLSNTVYHCRFVLVLSAP